MVEKLELPVAFSCPVCGCTEVKFSGVRAGLFLRAEFSWVAPFVCASSHTFLLPFTDGSQAGKAATGERVARGMRLEKLSVLLARCSEERARAKRLCAQARRNRMLLAVRWGEPKSWVV